MMAHTKINGQTLIETLITVLFIGAGIMALVRFQGYLAYEKSLLQQRGRAAILAVNQIETLRDFQVLNNTSGYTSYQSIATGNATTVGTTTTYSTVWTVTSYTNPTYKNINVTVSWPDRNGITQSVQYITNVAGIDPQNSAAVM